MGKSLAEPCFRGWEQTCRGNHDSSVPAGQRLPVKIQRWRRVFLLAESLRDRPNAVRRTGSMASATHFVSQPLRVDQRRLRRGAPRSKSVDPRQPNLNSIPSQSPRTNCVPIPHSPTPPICYIPPQGRRALARPRRLSGNPHPSRVQTPDTRRKRKPAALALPHRPQAYSHRRMSLKTGGEEGGRRGSFLMNF